MAGIPPVVAKAITRVAQAAQRAVGTVDDVASTGQSTTKALDDASRAAGDAATVVKTAGAAADDVSKALDSTPAVSDDVARASAKAADIADDAATAGAKPPAGGPTPPPTGPSVTAPKPGAETPTGTPGVTPPKDTPGTTPGAKPPKDTPGTTPGAKPPTDTPATKPPKDTPGTTTPPKTGTGSGRSTTDAAIENLLATAGSRAGQWGWTAGMIGIGATVWNTFRDGFFKDGEIGKDLGLSSATLMLGGGLLMLTVAGKSDALKTGAWGDAMRAGALAPIVGGLVGAGMTSFRLTAGGDQNAVGDGRIEGLPFDVNPPTTIEDLRGSRLADADVKLRDKDKGRNLSVYLDPATAVKVPGGTYEAAVEMANAAVRNDKDGNNYLFRSQAVIQTADGAYWIVRLTGDLDQLDGPKFAEGNEHDPLHSPRIRFVREGVKALVGVDQVFRAPDRPAPRDGDTTPAPVTPVDPQPVPADPPVTPADPTAPATATAGGS